MAKPSKEKLVVSPKAVEVTYLDEIAGRLADIYDHLKETTPEGKTVLIFEGTVNPPGKGLDVLNDRPYRKLFGVDVINNGPDTVFVKIDEEEVPVEVDESILFPKPKALIKFINLRVTESTSVKLIGHY